MEILKSMNLGGRGSIFLSVSKTFEEKCRQGFWFTLLTYFSHLTNIISDVDSAQDAKVKF